MNQISHPLWVVNQGFQLLVGVLGVFWLTSGLFSGMHLSLDRARRGVVVSAFSNPGPTNYPGVVWGGGVLLVPQPDDWDTLPSVGDQVEVLPWPGAGTLRTGHAILRVWEQVAFYTLIGLILLACGYLLRSRSTRDAIHLPKTA